MGCIVQLLLAVFGVVLVLIPAFRYRDLVLGRPHTIFMGMILLIQLPVGLFAGAAAGAAEGMKAADAGVKPSAKVIAEKYAWLDLAVAGLAASVAGAIGLRAIRRDLPIYAPPEQIAGVRDFAAEMQDRQAAKKEEVDNWCGNIKLDSLPPRRRK